MSSESIEQAWSRAFAAAAAHQPHPNPRVGAAIVDATGGIVSVGSHVGPGAEHAELAAIKAAGVLSPGSTMVVTLEPCNHTGRTPPCTAAIIEAGIDRVLVAAIDPDTKVSGSGVDALREQGVAVDVADPSSDLALRAVRLDPGYFHHRRTGRAQVVLKVAATLDGQTAARDGSSQWITGPEMRQRVHELRSTADAVLIGAGTLRSDDPSLTVRLDGFSGRQPRPVLVAGRRDLPRTSQIWDRNPIVVTTHTIDVPSGDQLIVDASGGMPDLREVMQRLPDFGVLRVFVEAGAILAAALLADGVVDIGVTHLGGKLALGLGAPMFSGEFASISDALRIEISEVAQIGNDVEIIWKPAES